MKNEKVEFPFFPLSSLCFFRWRERDTRVPTIPPVFFYALFSFSLYSSLPLPTKEKEKKAQNTGGTVGTVVSLPPN
jgi:hypothetical protein